MPSPENDVSCSRKRRKIDTNQSSIGQRLNNLIDEKDSSVLVRGDKNVSEPEEPKATTANPTSAKSLDPCVKSEITDITVKSEHFEDDDSSNSESREEEFLNKLLEETLYAKQQEFFSRPEVLSDLNDLTESRAVAAVTTEGD